MENVFFPASIGIQLPITYIIILKLTQRPMSSSPSTVFSRPASPRKKTRQERSTEEDVLEEGELKEDTTSEKCLFFPKLNEFVE